MIIRTVALAGLLSMGVGAAIYTPPAAARGYVEVTVAPPALRVEEPVVREGCEWAPGYYRWDGHDYVWVGGSCLAARPHYHYVGATWVQAGTKWRYHEGHWDH